MHHNMTFSQIAEHYRADLQQVQVSTHILTDDGTFPNNSELPLLVYHAVADFPEQDPAAVFETIFAQQHWSHSWRNGIFSYHHYHSTAHEVLGVYRGSARVQLGGDQGVVLDVQAGDVILIPAGVAHKNLGASPDFQVVGAYPSGQSPDMRYGKAGERPEADQNIQHVPLPSTDPLYGARGPVQEHWGETTGIDI